MRFRDHIFRSMAACVLFAQPFFLCAEETTPSKNVDPKADALIRSFADYLASVKSVSVDISGSMHVIAPGMRSEIVNEYELALQRPDEIAIIHKEGMFGITAVSDDTTFTIYNSLTRTYTTKPVPEELDQILARIEEESASGPMQGLSNLKVWGSKPYEAMMDEVTSGVYVGKIELDGLACHHLKFAQGEFDWEAWVRVEDPPVLVKLTIDLSRWVEQASEDMAGMSGMEMSIEMLFSDWKFNEQIPPEKFQFTPPADAVLEESADGDEEVSELLGKPAPDFDLPLLDGGRARLEDLTSTVVVLDFWASWCGPCREGLPVIAKVAEQFAPQGVKVFAVNVMEEEDEIREFLEEEKLQLAVALDANGETAEAYGAQAIPTTIVIGRDGRVQAVHVGLSSGLEQQLTSELEAVLRGEDLAGKSAEADTTATRAGAGASAAAESDPLQEQWSVAGRWMGVAYDKNRAAILALGYGKYVEIDDVGTITNETPLNTRSATLRLAHTGSSSPPNLVTFTRWGEKVQVFDADGKQLWSYPRSSGVDDVWTGNFTGDERDEVVIGYNGLTGLHSLDPDGKPLWKYMRIGNVWYVCTGDLDGDGSVEVISTSARGRVHIFDASGKKIKDINPGFYATLVRFAAGSNGPRVLVSGSGDKEEVLGAYDFDGDEKWRITLERGRSHLLSAAVSAAGDKIAVGMRGGKIIVVDTATGKIIGKATGQGNTPEVGWAEIKSGESSGPLLLVATGKALNAFAVPAADGRSAAGRLGGTTIRGAEHGEATTNEHE